MSKSERSNRVIPVRWLLVVVLFAAASRFWHLDSLPPGLHPREAEYALQALGLPSTGVAGPLPVALVRLSFNLFEATPWAVRATSALAGVLLVLATYAAAATLLKTAKRLTAQPFPLAASTEPEPSDWWPLLAALISSSLYPALSLSRWGAEHLWGSVLATLAVACFWHGLNAAALPTLPHSRSRTSFLSRWPWLTLSPWHPATPALSLGLAGLWAGLGWLTTAAAIPFPLLLALFILFWVRFNRSLPVTQQPPWWSLGLTFLLTGLPGLFLSPFESWVGQLAHLPAPGQLLAGLFWAGTSDLAINQPGRPFLDGGQAILFLLGLGVLAWRWRNERGLFLALWLAFTLLPALLSHQRDYWPHLLFAAAPLSLLMALGLGWLGQQMGHLSQRTWRRPLFTGAWIVLPMLLLWLPSLILTLRAYFVTYANQPALNQTFAATEWRLGQHAAAYPPETLLYFVPPPEPISTIQFALQNSQRLWTYQGDGLVLPLGRVQTPVLYLVQAEQTQALAQLRVVYPEATISEAPVEGYTTVYLPAFLPRLPQSHPTDLLLGGEIALLDWQMVEEGDALQVTLYWQAAASPAQDYVAYVQLLDEQGQVLAQTEQDLSGYPTHQWRRLELVSATFSLPVTALPNANRLITGFYALTSGARIGETTLQTWP